MTKPECGTASVGLFSLGHLDFVILSSFVIRHLAFVIDFYQSLASEHANAVPPTTLCSFRLDWLCILIHFVMQSLEHQ